MKVSASVKPRCDNCRVIKRKGRGQNHLLQRPSRSNARANPSKRRLVMVRIAGVDVPDRKRAHVALRSIYGVGPTTAAEILDKAGLDTESPPPA